MIYGEVCLLPHDLLALWQLLCPISPPPRRMASFSCRRLCVFGFWRQVSLLRCSVSIRWSRSEERLVAEELVEICLREIRPEPGPASPLFGSSGCAIRVEAEEAEAEEQAAADVVIEISSGEDAL